MEKSQQRQSGRAKRASAFIVRAPKCLASIEPFKYFLGDAYRRLCNVYQYVCILCGQKRYREIDGRVGHRENKRLHFTGRRALGSVISLASENFVPAYRVKSSSLLTAELFYSRQVSEFARLRVDQVYLVTKVPLTAD